MELAIKYLTCLVAITFVAPRVSEALEVLKIIGGSDADVGEFPCIVSIQDISQGTERHYCGGAIYSDTYVLTAAHCVFNVHPETIQIVAGEYDRSNIEGTEQTILVEEINTHPDYDVDTMVNDVALLKLSQKLIFNSYVQSIHLLDGSLPGHCVIAGWGATTEGGNPVNILQKADVPIWDDESCIDAYPDETVLETNLCAGEPSGEVAGCHGDDGGPLICHGHKLTALGSWSIGCGRPNKPGVFVELSYFKEWIEDSTIM